MRSHLLIPTDFSMPAKTMLANLDDFRHAGGERITLLHVREVAYPIGGAAVDDKYYRELLSEAAQELEKKGWAVDVKYEEGRPGTKICAVTESVDADLIVMANHGHSAASEVILGSVATDVLERSTTPVFLFCTDAVEVPLWDRIVHPTDFSQPAMAALDWAADQAIAEGTPLVLLHAVDDRLVGKARAEKRRQKIDKLRDKMQTKGVNQVETQVLEGPPKKVVVEAADHYPGALFAMGFHGRGWFGDLMLGGVARAMARRGTHHVLYVG